MPGGGKPFAVDTTHRRPHVCPYFEVTIPAAEVMVEAGGHLMVASTIDLAGEFDLTAGSRADRLGRRDPDGLPRREPGGQRDARPLHDDALGPGGLVADVGLAFSGGLGGGHPVDLGQPRAGREHEPGGPQRGRPEYVRSALNNASVNILGLQASGSLIAGVSDGVFEVDVPASNPLSLNFFGLGELSLSGFIRSDGHFSVTGAVGFDLGSSIGDLYGGISVTISDQGFTGSFYGGANVYTIFGTINLGLGFGSLVVDSSHVHVAASST